MSSDTAAPTRTPRRGPNLVLYGAGWLLLGLWLGVNSALGHRGDVPTLPLWQPMTWELSSTVTIGALALLVSRFEAHAPLGGGHTLRRLPLHLVAAALFSLLHVAMMVGLRKGIYALAGTRYDFGGLLPLFYEFQKDVISYALIVGACAFLRTRRERRQRELDALRLARELSNARLAQLSAQIEPHFIFNALNTIANRMHEDVHAADNLPFRHGASGAHRALCGKGFRGAAPSPFRYGVVRVLVGGAGRSISIMPAATRRARPERAVTAPGLSRVGAIWVIRGYCRAPPWGNRQSWIYRDRFGFLSKNGDTHCRYY